MKELERYLGATYSGICQPAITAETAATFPNPVIPTITDLVTKHPKIDGEITYFEKKSMRPSAKI